MQPLNLGTLFLILCFCMAPLNSAVANNIKLIKKGEYAPLVTNLINESQDEVVVVMYLVSYNLKYAKRGPVANLLNALIRANRRKVNVRVILDKNNDFRHTGKEDNKNKLAFDYLQKNGVNVTYDSLRNTTHSKVVVIDKKLVIIGSTNWSFSALEKNHETSLLIQSKELAQETLIHLKDVPK